MSVSTSLVPTERIERCILLVRGHKVLLDAALAELYGVDTRTLVQTVKRNIERFPADFTFQLSEEEFTLLRSQSVISNARGGRRYAPYAFTEQGVAMLSSVLRSKRAAQVNVEIMRTFVKLRLVLASHADLRKKLLELECKYDEQFKVVFDAIRQLIEQPVKQTPRIGFTSK